VFFNTGCNEKVFSPETLKKNLAQIRLVDFEKIENRLSPTHSNSEK